MLYCEQSKFFETLEKTKKQVFWKKKTIGKWNLGVNLVSQIALIFMIN